MTNLIAKIAKRLGWKTYYHVVFLYTAEEKLMINDGTACVRPWLRQGETFDNLRAAMNKEALISGITKPGNIISITRIGR